MSGSSTASNSSTKTNRPVSTKSEPRSKRSNSEKLVSEHNVPNIAELRRNATCYVSGQLKSNHIVNP